MGADVNARASRGDTPLIWAAYCNSYETVKFLCQQTDVDTSMGAYASTTDPGNPAEQRKDASIEAGLRTEEGREANVVKLLLLGEARGEGDMTAGVGRRARPSGGRWIPARVYSWGDLHDNDNDESPFLSTIHEQDEEIKRLRDVIHGLKQAKEVDGSNDGSDDEKDQEQSVDDLRDEVEHLKTENEVLNDALSILREKFKNIEQKQKEELETETIEAKRRLDKVLDGDEEEIELIRRHRESFVGSVINKNEMLIAERDKAARENEVRLQILREVHERELKLSEENQELKHQVDDLRAQVNKQVKGFEEQIQILSDLHAEELKKQLEQSHAEFERQMDKVNMIEQEKHRLKTRLAPQCPAKNTNSDCLPLVGAMGEMTKTICWLRQSTLMSAQIRGKYFHQMKVAK
eukprot:CAMPEP_0197541676 /NCGR_PEP_ID=MMETSP1318-20131121/67289_1 /TAXON_ID=552666 /ORGANISM="Partenskyella glossopodia, Strain RCC365" /LENGTH=405 /DNA_ID=CAMNT_0043100877 /DNA_START=396 /DNA_END=1613 /DNA_ORIENTATION=-